MRNGERGMEKLSSGRGDMISRIDFMKIGEVSEFVWEFIVRSIKRSKCTETAI